MKKRLFFLLLIVVLASCSNEKPKDPNTAVFIEENLKNFIAGNADWTVEPTQAEITEKFKHQVINWSNAQDFLKNMPLRLKAINDTLISGQSYKIAVFESFDKSERPKESLLNDINLQLSGIIADHQAKTLKIGKNYTISGTLYKQGKRADIKFIHAENSNTYDLGKYIFTINSFKEL